MSRFIKSIVVLCALFMSMSLMAREPIVTISNGGTNPGTIDYTQDSTSLVSFTITPPVGYVVDSVGESSTGPGSSTLTELTFGQSYTYSFSLAPVSVYTITVIFAQAEDFASIYSMGVNDLTATLIIEVR